MDSESAPNLFLILYCFLYTKPVSQPQHISYIPLTSPWNDSIQQEDLKYTPKAV